MIYLIRYAFHHLKPFSIITLSSKNILFLLKTRFSKKNSQDLGQRDLYLYQENLKETRSARLTVDRNHLTLELPDKNIDRDIMYKSDTRTSNCNFYSRKGRFPLIQELKFLVLFEAEILKKKMGAKSKYIIEER